MHTGSCLCNGVRFEIDGDLAPIQICHCEQCRKAQGTPFASNIPVALTSFRLNEGRDLLREFESSPGKQRVFCSRCGSPIFSKRDQLPDVIRIRAGLIDSTLGTKPTAHFYVGSKADWWEINDHLPKFSEADIAQAQNATKKAT
ncbi:MAG: aldehyde-activating protein [Burkholderiales bacterium RIFCSPLOWO2_02_FULL_57_36]|nr:MAG: aldehyde-activating protein [Burkholderiales bacterium RIFCSPLOWO2_02_FULL_57_36]